MPPEQSTFLAAARSFAALVEALPADLTGPGLGSWDLRALVGHTSRALVTVRDYLERPASSLAFETAADYLAGASADPEVAAGVAARGVAAGVALGPAPASYVAGLVAEVEAALATADPDQLVTTVGGGMRLSDYLPTRTFELVVHGLDVAGAVPLRWAPPPEALASAVRLAGEVAVRRGEGTIVLRLLTGREPGGISVV